MGIAGNLRIVRHQNYGDSRRVELLEHPQDFHAGVRIEITCRLVRQQQRRLIDKRTSNGHPLLLTTRHLRWFVVEPRRQAHAFQQFDSPLVRIV